MPTYKVFRIHNGAKSCVLALIGESIRQIVVQDPHTSVAKIGAAAHAAGFDGPVALCWVANGEVEFLAPTDWQSFLSTMPCDLMPEKPIGEITWQ